MYPYSENPIKNKRIQDFMMRQNQPYWTRYKFGSKWYIMTFEYNVYLVNE